MVDVPAVGLRPGVVVASDGGGLLVDCDGAALPAVWLGSACPEPGGPVRVLSVAGARFAVPASLAPRSLPGTVVAGPDERGLVAVDTGEGGLAMALFVGDAPEVGSRVAVSWEGVTPLVLGPVSGEPAGGSAVRPDPPPDTRRLQWVFPAAQSGTWRYLDDGSGWLRSDDVVFGAVNASPDGSEVAEYLGVWWHGDQVEILQSVPREELVEARVDVWLPAEDPSYYIEGEGDPGVLPVFVSMGENGARDPDRPGRFSMVAMTELARPWAGGWFYVSDGWLAYQMLYEGWRCVGVALYSTIQRYGFPGVSRDPVGGAVRITMPGHPDYDAVVPGRPDYNTDQEE